MSLDKERLVFAVHAVLKHYTHEDYGETFPKGYLLSSDWFKKFMNDWSVARTIKKSGKEPTRKYLYRHFAPGLWKNGSKSRRVDKAARHIAKQGWSARGRKPTSLVSKVGYFYRPESIVPMDRLARAGLKELVKSEGEGFHTEIRPSMSYEKYEECFGKMFKKYRVEIAAACTKSWAREFLWEIGRSDSCLSSNAFRKKVFDNYLMLLGRTHVKL